MNSHGYGLARSLLSSAVMQSITLRRNQHMRKIGIALWVVAFAMTLFVTSGAFAAPPDEVNAPRGQDSVAV